MDRLTRGNDQSGNQARSLPYQRRHPRRQGGKDEEEGRALGRTIVSRIGHAIGVRDNRNMAVKSRSRRGEPSPARCPDRQIRPPSPSGSLGQRLQVPSNDDVWGPDLVTALSVKIGFGQSWRCCIGGHGYADPEGGAAAWLKSGSQQSWGRA